MRRFEVSTAGSNRLDLRRLCEEVVNDLWVPAHLSPEQAAAFVLDHFKRAIAVEMKLLEVTCRSE